LSLAKSRSQRDGSAEEHMENNTGEGDGKVKGQIWRKVVWCDWVSSAACGPQGIKVKATKKKNARSSFQAHDHVSK